ncbi:MAG: hypothetical protein QXT26_00620 [Thermoproteota archaeon]
MSKSIILLFILVILFQSKFTRTCAQNESEFSITVDEQQLEVVLLDTEKRELFGIAIQKNGGISELRISNMQYANTIGFYIWNEAGGQSYSSNATAEPVIEYEGEYVTITCYGKYASHQLSMITNITVSKTGIILFSSRMVGERDEPTILMIAWDSFIPMSLFAGEKIHVYAGKNVREVSLPINFVTNPVFTHNDVKWIDFSKPLEGITLINIAPYSHQGATIQDEREWNGTTYSARYNIRGWGQKPVEQGEEFYAKVAIYVHGPGGYQANQKVIDLLVTFADLERRLKEIESFKSDKAHVLASQARTQINMALNKMLVGDLNSATEMLNRAEEFIKEAEGIETMRIAVYYILRIVIPIVILAITLYIILKRIRRRKIKQPLN